MKMEFFPDAEVLQWWDLLLLGAAEKRWWGKLSPEGPQPAMD
jgi:hypothetical protein